MQIVGVIVSQMSPPSCHLFSLAQGDDACFKTNNINAGTNSCHGHNSCKDVSDSTIANDSCHGQGSCEDVSDSTIANDSCHGDYSCEAVKNSIIGTGSCNDSSHAYSCDHLDNIKIGNMKALLKELGFNWNGASCSIT